MKYLSIKYLTLAALGASLLTTQTAQAEEGFLPKWPVLLQSDVSKIAKRFGGQFSLYVKDLSTDELYTHNAATPMYLASGIKVPVMVALFQQIEAGKVSLEQQVKYRPSDIRDGTPLLNYLRPGTPVSLEILVEAMIQQSDNAATDMVIRQVGLDQVNMALVKEGVYGFGPITTLIDVRRLVYRNMDPRTKRLKPNHIFSLAVAKPLKARVDLLAEFIDESPGFFTVGDYERAYSNYYLQGYNSAPMNSMGALLEGLAEGRIVSPEASQKMLDIMLGTKTGVKRIRGGLPAWVKLAHKTGTQFRRTCDFGIFYLAKDRPVIFAISVKGGTRAAAEATISKLARRAFERITAQHPAGPPASARIHSRSLDALEEDLLNPGRPSKAKKRKRRRLRKKRSLKSAL